MKKILILALSLIILSSCGVILEAVGDSFVSMLSGDSSDPQYENYLFYKRNFDPEGKMTFDEYKKHAANAQINQGSSSSYTSSRSSSYSTSSSTKCSFCNGTGQVFASYTSTYGLGSSREWCDICKSNMGAHSHKQCPSCKGKGYN